MDQLDMNLAQDPAQMLAEQDCWRNISSSILLNCSRSSKICHKIQLNLAQDPAKYATRSSSILLKIQLKC
jgi:hypothetical protein